MCERLPTNQGNSSEDAAPSTGHADDSEDQENEVVFDPSKNEFLFRLLPDSIPDDVSEVTWRMGSEGKSTMPSFGPEDHLFDLSSEENVCKSLYDDDEGATRGDHPLTSGMSRLSLDESQDLYDDDDDNDDDDGDNYGEKSVDTTNASPKSEQRLNLLDLCDGKIIIANELSGNQQQSNETQEANAQVSRSVEEQGERRRRTRTRRRRVKKKSFQGGQKSHDNKKKEQDDVARSKQRLRPSLPPASSGEQIL